MFHVTTGLFFFRPWYLVDCKVEAVQDDVADDEAGDASSGSEGAGLLATGCLRGGESTLLCRPMAGVCCRGAAEFVRRDMAEYYCWADVPRKQFHLAVFLSAILGWLGIDRLYLGYTAVGVLKLLTLGGCYIWGIVDIFLVQNRAREVNFEKVMSLL